MKARRKHPTSPKRLRARAEQLLGTTRREVAQMPVDDVQKLVQELQVHQIELKMQNDELRRTQLELEQARDRYADLYDFAPTAYLTLNAHGEILEANLNAGELLGLERGRLIHQKFSRFVPAEAQDTFYLFCRQVFSSDARQSAELDLVNAQAKRLFVHVEAVRDAANLRKQCRFSFNDITERKRAEEMLARSEARFRGLFESMQEGFFLAELVYDRAGKPVDWRFLDVNPAHAKIMGLKRDAVVGRTVRALFPGLEDFWFEAASRVALTGEPAWVEGFVQDTGRYHDCHYYSPRRGQFACIFTDITERQRAEERIAQLNRVQTILAGIDRAIVHISDRQKLLDEVCRVAVEKGGFKLAWIGMVAPDGSVQPVAQAGATGYLEGIHVVTHDVPEGRGPVGSAMRENRPVVIEDVGRNARMAPWHDRARQFGLHYVAAFPIRIASKVAGAFQVYAPRADFFDENELGLLTQVSDEISFALTVISDLTARKQAEEALRRSEHNLSSFFSQAPTGLVWLSASGTILRANQAQLDLLGYSAEDYLGHSFNEFSVEPSQGRELLKRLAAKATVRNFPMIRRCKDGRIRHVLVDANSFWSNGQFEYSSIFLRDITDRVKLEREILQVGEREHRRIAQDLHDGLGQLLAGTAYLAGTLRKELAAKSLPEARQLGRILKVIYEAIAQTRNLARGLHPVEPEPNGLMVALQTLAARTKKLFHVGCHFNCRRPVLIEDNAVATHLFRIAQEAITNAIKHGKPGRIEIGLTETPGRINLAIKDNGAGMPTRQRKESGMGLRIMRYRAGMIGGSLAIQKEAGGGTAIVCSVHLSGEGIMNHHPNAIRKKD
jgi:two-component system sensor kinase FixL